IGSDRLPARLGRDDGRAAAPLARPGPPGQGPARRPAPRVARVRAGPGGPGRGHLGPGAADDAGRGASTAAGDDSSYTAGPAPPGWTAAVGRALQDRDGRVVDQAVATIRALEIADFDEALIRLARDPSRPEDLRVQALAAAAPRLSSIGPEVFTFLTSFQAPE